MRLVLHPKVYSSAITIDIHLLDPGAEYLDTFLNWRNTKEP
jgi:hypothetical protein